jgi:hypothetical protein
MPDPRLDLERLPSEHLYEIARNSSAVHRLLAFQLLVERGSHLACRDEIAADAKQYVLNDPLVLKKIDPASAALAPAKLPNIIDCLAHEKTQRVDLTSIVNEHHTVHSENHVVHTQTTAALNKSVNENKVANAQAIAEAYAVLWRDYTRKVFHLKLDHGNEIAELTAEAPKG